MITNKPGQELQYALGLLSNSCDGASSRDGSGFNRTDSQIGHRMSMTPQSTWSEEDKKDMLHLLKKYKKQLLTLGFDYDKELVMYFYLEVYQPKNRVKNLLIVKRPSP